MTEERLAPRPADGVPATILREALRHALESVRHASVASGGGVAQGPPTPVVLAVSGGADSMALLHAMARWAPEHLRAVATFDHGTGEAARRAARFVATEARRLGVPVVCGRDPSPARTEAGWREARWAFLREVATERQAVVATGHTRDDQIETVVQRTLRGAGARGLAGLDASGRAVRPWLTVSRATLRAWLTQEGLPWVEDPANADRRIQRVRLRLDVLPAFEAASPGFADAMHAVGARAAAWRRDAERFAGTLGGRWLSTGVFRVPRSATAGWTAPMLAVVWPVWLAQGGVVLDGDGTRRLLRFTLGSESAGEVQLPGGATVVRTASHFELRPPRVAAQVVRGRAAAADGATVSHVVRRRVSSRLRPVFRWPGWSFWRLPEPPDDPDAANVAAFVPGTTLVVRAWRPGDRIVTARAGAARRLVRYLVEAGVPRLDRPAWPVVLADGDVAWAPDVCRGLTAPPRSGWSDLIWYRSEREFG
jgi:tRNA(Ile)-lysidine synthase